LRRWLNRFVARVEPTELDERLRRSLEDRYVSVRPDLDGVSFLSACMSSLDAASVDLMLDALAGIAEPGDPRNKQQRRADALVDLLMGRISNGWQPGPGDHGGLDEPIDPVEPAQQCRGVIDGASEAPTQPDGDRAWDADDWDLPASAFRPDPTAEEPEPTEEEGVVGHADAENVPDPDEEPTDTADPEPASRGQGQPPPQVTIGVVISIQSLLGFTDAPGELADGSAHVPAAVIRELAAQPETPVLPTADRPDRESARRHRAGPVPVPQVGRGSSVPRRRVFEPDLPRCRSPLRPRSCHPPPGRADRRMEP
jgi:hypothetical protein